MPSTPGDKKHPTAAQAGAKLGKSIGSYPVVTSGRTHFDEPADPAVEEAVAAFVEESRDWERVPD